MKVEIRVCTCRERLDLALVRRRTCHKYNYEAMLFVCFSNSYSMTVIAGVSKIVHPSCFCASLPRCLVSRGLIAYPRDLDYRSEHLRRWYTHSDQLRGRVHQSRWHLCSSSRACCRQSFRPSFDPRH